MHVEDLWDSFNS